MYRNLQRLSKPRTSVRSCAGSSSTTMTSAKAHPDRRQPVDSAVLTRRLISGGMWRNCRPRRARGCVCVCVCENAPSLPRPRRPRPHRCRRCGRRLAHRRVLQVDITRTREAIEARLRRPQFAFKLAWGPIPGAAGAAGPVADSSGGARWRAGCWL